MIVEFETLLAPSGEVQFAGGVLIEPLPQSTYQLIEKTIEDYGQHLKFLPPVPVLFNDDEKDLQAILATIALQPLTKVDKIVMDFHCRCGRDMYLRQLRSLAVEDRKLFLQEESNGEEIVVVCQFCNAEYTFGHHEVEPHQ